MSDCFSTVLCLGSNVADREQIISRAIARLEILCDITLSSSIYEAPDDSGLGGPYLNVVMSVVPDLPYDEFRLRLKEMECEFGRNEQSKSIGYMPLDVDIIIWNGEIVDRYQYSREYFQKGFRELKSSL
ncbi:MAG: 2-amino-4-hydroxy-6-hydroxymethyldihydropteridine diphosphokinase [Muribaculaceae bacterium]|nr:2-amino-4-hydroxy-6-hydroxymethyldihydropteridine diphosphokinase [Muribaculaceae bacterium]